MYIILCSFVRCIHIYIYIMYIHDVYTCHLYIMCRQNMFTNHAYHTSMLALFGQKTYDHLAVFCNT